MKLYKNIRDLFDYDNIVFTEDLIDLLDLSFEDYDFFFELSKWHRGSIFQYVKSEENTNDTVISEFSENYEDDCGDDIDTIKELFDNTSEVHEIGSNSLSLIKINSKDFFNKLKESTIIYCAKGEDSGLENCSLRLEGLCEELLGDLYYDEELVFSLGYYFGCKRDDLTYIFESQLVDDAGNLISWASYYAWDTMGFRLGYKKK